MEGLASTFESFKQSLSSIGSKIGEIFTAIGEIAGNVVNGIGNFFSTLWEHLLNIISYINPFSDNFLGKKIVESIGDLLKDLFVPENSPFDEISSKINEKFPFVSQVQELFSYLVNYDNYGNTVPSFEMTWNGTTFSLISFDLFLDYRVWLHGIILAIAWFIFIRKTFYKIPQIIGGFK